MKTLIYLASLLAPGRFRAAWREEWLAELHAARRSGAGRTLRLVVGAPFDAFSSRWTTRTSRERGGHGPWRTDVKQTVRSLSRSPGHVLVVALCLGVGIAVSTATFSILNAYTNGDLPGVTDRSRLARLHLNGGNTSVDDYEIIREGSPSFAGIAVEGRKIFAVRVEGQAPTNVEGAFVSGNYFEVLGTQPRLGRLLQSADDRSDAPLAVAISHAFWTARLGAREDVAGKPIVIGGRHAVIAGVAPEGFRGIRGGESNDNAGFAVYVPVAHTRDWPGGRASNQRWLNVYGRLTVPLNPERLQAELGPIAARIHAARPPAAGTTFIAVTETWRTPDITTPMVLFMYLLMLAAPATVLAIGSANVANLQLVRASLRTRELAMRASLGASRRQLIRLLTFEAVLLVLVALGTAAIGISLLLRVATAVLPISVAVDGRVLLFGAGLAVVVIVATGLLPGLIATRADVSAHLRSGGRAMASGNSRLRRGLVVAQVALSFLLLLVGGFFVRGFIDMVGSLPPHAPHTIVANLRFDVLPKYGPAERRAFLDAFEARMRADGRVRGVAYTSESAVWDGPARMWKPGETIGVGQIAEAIHVAGDYFETAGMRVVRGRPLTSADAAATTAVVVNQDLIADFDLQEPVVGQTVRLSLSSADYAAGQFVTIVGVAEPLVPPPGDFDHPKVYLAFDTPLDFVTAWIGIDNAASRLDMVRRSLADLDPELPAVGVNTLEQIQLKNSELPYLVARTASGLGLVALLLAVSGLYSVIAFFVALRTSEFGIRVALGARSADIVRMVLGQALRLATLGLVVGAVLGVPLLIALTASFPFTSEFDPAVVLAPALALALTAFTAGWLPARRASSIQASDALRAD